MKNILRGLRVKNLGSMDPVPQRITEGKMQAVEYHLPSQSQ